MNLIRLQTQLFNKYLKKDLLKWKYSVFLQPAFKKAVHFKGFCDKQTSFTAERQKFFEILDRNIANNNRLLTLASLIRVGVSSADENRDKIMLNILALI